MVASDVPWQNHQPIVYVKALIKSFACHFAALRSAPVSSRFCGLAEALRVWQLGVDFELLTLDTAGDYAMGEPFFQEEDELSILKTQELKHGRLAMIAVGGAITQAVSCNAHHFPFVPCSSC